MSETSQITLAQTEAAPKARAWSPAARWQPAPLIHLTLAIHAVGCVALAFEPAWWGWALSAVAANHALIGLAVAFPRGRWLGSNVTRLPQAAATRREIALTFDDGPDPAVTPQVLDILDAYQARATFFCIARNAQDHPALVREIIRRGHDVENHSYRHSLGFALYAPTQQARDIDKAQSALTEITQRAPRFFRAPAGMRGPLLEPILQQRGLRYVSWTRRGFDATERKSSRVLSRLTRQLAGGDILLLHDGGTARTAAGKPVVLDVLPGLLSEIRSRDLNCVTLADGIDDAGV